jgi:hypothetical protein
MQLLSSRKWALAGAMLAVLLVLFAGGGGVIYAANGAVPGDPLYGLDQAMETTRLRLTSRPEAVVGLLLALAQERLEEAQDLLEAGDLENLGAALEGYGSTVSSLATTLGETEDDQAQELAGLVDVSFSGDLGQEPGSSTELTAETDQDEPELDDADYCTGTETHPVAAALAETYDVEYDQIMGWFCDDNFGLGEIMLALETSQQLEDSANALTVDELLSIRGDKPETAMGWGQVWQDVGLIGKGKASVGPPSAFPVGPSEVADVPEAAQAGPVRAGAELDDPELSCTGVLTHPVAAKLADSYGLDYEQVMAWFCEHSFGLGEIKLALETTEVLSGTEWADLSATDLLSERLESKGWGQIWQEYGLIGRGNGDDSDDPGEGEEDLDDTTGYYCDEAAARRHPVALRLSETYTDTLAVPYDQIMGWFCDSNFGLGEIKLAMEASKAIQENGLPEDSDLLPADMTPEYLLGLRAETGWGEVWHDLGFLGKPSKDKFLAPQDDVTADTLDEKKVPPGKEKEKKPKLQKPAKPKKPAKPEKPDKPEKPSKPAKPEKPAKPPKG